MMNNLMYCKAESMVDDYIVLDFETTGLNANFDKIIEVSFLKYRNNELVDELVTLVNPNTTISPLITSITGIDNEMVQGKPYIEELIPLIIAFIDDFTLVGHNVNFDLRFLKAAVDNYAFGDYQLNYQYLDTLYIARKKLPYLPNHRLETLKKHYQVEEISHRAKQDCLVTNIVFQNLKKI